MTQLSFELKQIGIIRTPYTDNAPYQPVDKDKGNLDVFDGTPLLDIKPYIKDLDTKIDANYGWIEEIGDREHLLLHIKGIPHDY